MPEREAEALRRTPLFPLYEQYGARVVDFHGWALPVQFSGIIEEHRSVRERAGLFDVSHMGEIELSGPGALETVQKLTVNDASRLRDGQVQYSAMCYPDGGIVDDLTVYRFSAERYLFCVNSANIDKDRSWISEHLGAEVTMVDKSVETALIALQGPLAEKIADSVAGPDLRGLRYYHFVSGEIAGVPAVLSRTGYTGEDGFEMYHSGKDSIKLWQGLMEAGAPFDLVPAGLGARDTLRLEMKYALYGNDIDAGTDPYEAGLGWITKPDKGDFIGRESILRRKESGRRKLVGFELKDRGVARAGCVIMKDQKRIGEVTSGSFAPSLGKSIGMGYVTEEFSPPGSIFEIDVRGRGLKAEAVRTPFYREGSARVGRKGKGAS